jgi:uncharacterized membrane protein
VTTDLKMIYYGKIAGLKYMLLLLCVMLISPTIVCSELLIITVNRADSVVLLLTYGLSSHINCSVISATYISEQRKYLISLSLTVLLMHCSLF